MRDGLKVELFRRKHRETFLKVKPHLVAERADRTRSRTVSFFLRFLTHDGTNLYIVSFFFILLK